MIDKYEKIVGDLELLDFNKHRDNLILSYRILDTIREHDFDFVLNIDLTQFLKNVGIDSSTYSFECIEDNIKYVKYTFIMTIVNRKGIWQMKISKNEMKTAFIRFGVDKNDVDELLNEIIEELTYDAIEKLNDLIVEDIDYYLRRDEYV